MEKQSCSQKEKHEIAMEKAKAHIRDSEAEKTARIFHMLSDLGRLKIVLTLMQGSTCVYHLTEVCGGTQSAVSHQLKLLRENGIVCAKRVGKTMEYALVDECVREIVLLAERHASCK